jgi:hypothetical protein
MIEVPNWIDEDYVTEIVRKLIEVETQRREIVERDLKKLELTGNDLEDFERFRDELWKKRKNTSHCRLQYTLFILHAFPAIHLHSRRIRRKKKARIPI